MRYARLIPNGALGMTRTRQWNCRGVNLVVQVGDFLIFPTLANPEIKVLVTSQTPRYYWTTG